MLLLASCKKEVDNYLMITPEKVTSYAGKNWSSISGEFKNKKDYRYSEVNIGSTLAAISLSAKDPNAPAINFTLLFNVDRQDRISAIVLHSADTLGIQTGDKLFLYFYEKSIRLLDGVYYTSAIDNYDNHVNMPVEDLLTKIRTLQWDEAALDIKSSRMEVQAGLYHGDFSFIIYPF